MGEIKPDWQSDDGSVRLFRADCLAVLPTLEGVDCVVTDPPYGIGYSHGGSSGVLARTTKFVGVKVHGDRQPFDPSPFLRWPCVIWGANNFNDKLPPSKRWLVWDKRDGLPSNDLSDCEIAFTNVDGTDRLYSCRWMGMLKDTERGHERLHPMQKPVAIMEWCLSFVAGETVCDPFMGSGSTGIACLKNGRRFVGCEIDEGYFQIAVKRIKRALAEQKEMLFPVTERQEMLPLAC